MKQQPTLQRLPIESLDTRGNIRQDYGDLKALAGTFEDGGPDEPPVVRPSGEGYVVEAGNRRVEAARRAGVDHLWCVVKPPLESAEFRKRQLIADLHHKPLTPLERARAMQAILDENPGLTKAGLARLLGRSKTEITQTIALLDLAKPAKMALQEEEISESIAELLIPLSQEEQEDVLSDILNTAGERSGKPTVRQAKRIVKRTTGAIEHTGQPQGVKERKEESLPDVYEELLEAGEPALPVHVLFELRRASEQVGGVWGMCRLNGCSESLKRQIGAAAREVRDVAERIELATRW